MSGQAQQKSPVIKELHLPMSRVKTIMKSSPDVESVAQDALYYVTKATELFLTHLAKESLEKTNQKSLEYQHIAEVVQTDDTLDFLRELMPRKITVKQYKEMMAEKKQSDESEDSESDSEDSS